MEPFFLGEYKLHALLGRGATACVYRAEHRPTGIECALKVLHPDRVLNDETRRSFSQELHTAASLRHANIARVHDHGLVVPADAAASNGKLAPNSPYVALEAFAGGDLAPWRGRLPWPLLRRVGHAVLAGLAHAHARGVIHRDLKPTNLLLDGPMELDRTRVALADFGIAWVVDPTAATENEEYYRGTPQYSPVEQLLGKGSDLGPWTDLYALGCTLWALCCGSSPFGGRSTPAVILAHDLGRRGDWSPAKEYPPRLQAWLDRAIQREIDDRFQTAAEARDAWVRIDSAPPPRPIPLPDASPLALRARMFGLRGIPLVGREPQKASLSAAFGRAMGGRTQAVVLSGAAGIGKSRLARWLQERADMSGDATCLRVQHSHNADSGHGLGHALGRLFRTHGREGVELTDRLKAALAGLGLTDPAELGMTLETIRPGTIEPPPRGSERRAVLRLVLSAIARRKPLILWLDDLQWGPQSAAIAAGLPRDTRILVVATVRPDHLRRGTVAANTLDALEANLEATRIELGPLDAEATRRLLEELLHVHKDVAERIARRAGGNPLFATQLVGDLVRRRRLRWSPSGYVADTEQPLPADLRRLWLDRIDSVVRRRAAAREALEVAAALGEVIDGEEWSELLASRGSTMSAFLRDSLVEDGLMLYEDSGLRFVHGLAREAMVERARETERWQDVCSWVADAVARAKPNDPRLAGLLLEAGRTRDAIAPALEAAVAAARAGDHDVAAESVLVAEQAMDALGFPANAPQRLRAVLVRARCARSRSAYKEGRDLLEGLPELALASGDRALYADVLHILGVLRRMTADRSAAEEALEASMAEWRTLGDTVEELDVLASLAQLHAEAKGREPLSYLREALERLPRVPRARGVGGRIRRLLGKGLLDTNRAEAIPLLDQAVEDAQVLFDLHMEARAHLCLSYAHRLDGRLSDALHAARRSRECCRRAGHSAAERDALLAIADCHTAAGDYAEADRRYEEVLAEFRRNGTHWVCVALVNQGILRGLQGRYAEVLTLVEEGRTHLEILQVPSALLVCDLLLLGAHLALGDSDRALPHLERLEKARTPIDDRKDSTRILKEAIAACEGLGRADLARRLLDVGRTLELPVDAEVLVAPGAP